MENSDKSTENTPKPSEAAVAKRFKMGVRIIVGLVILLLLGRFGLVSAVGAAVITLATGTWLIQIGFSKWGEDIDADQLLTSEEKLQNKDCRAIVAMSSFALLLGLCVVFSGADILFQQPQTSSIQKSGSAALFHGFSPKAPASACYLALLTALASVAVGGAFGFLLGHPRRLEEDPKKQEGRSGSSWLLKTGLDDIVDWLVKGITTVLLVQAHQLVDFMEPIAKQIGDSFGAGGGGTSGQVFASCVIVYFSVFGVGAGCLVTRTYLTGALGRADRATVKDFAFGKVNLHWGEILTLIGADRIVNGSSREQGTSELQNISKKIAALSPADLRTPQEIALWAKAKSMEGEHKDALCGFERAILLCGQDPELRLDHAVALHHAGNNEGSLEALEEARRHISKATPVLAVKNIYKSLTYALLFNEESYQRVLDLCNEFKAMPGMPFSGGIAVNEVCAYGWKFRAIAAQNNLTPNDGTTWKPMEEWPQDMIEAYQGALEGIRALLKVQPSWRSRFEALLCKEFEGKAKGDDDLEIFESFPDFRLALGLPVPT